MFFILIRASKVERVFSAIQFDILLTIAGPRAMGKALENAGVIKAMTAWLLSQGALLTVGGRLVACLLVYVVAVLMSIFLNGSAVVPMLAPLCQAFANERVCLHHKVPKGEEGVGLCWVEGALMSYSKLNFGKMLVFSLVFGAGSCFMSPLGCQTNLLVMSAGRYRSFHFVRFGSMLQIFHAILFMLLIAQFGLDKFVPPEAEGQKG